MKTLFILTLLILFTGLAYGDSKTDTTITPKKTGGAVIINSPSGSTSVTAGGTNGTSGVTITSGSTSGVTLLKGSSVKFQTYSGSWLDRFHIGSDGRIGVGTTSPAANFHIYSDQSLKTVFKIENPNAGATAYSWLTLLSTSSSYQGALFLTGSGNSSYGGPGALNLYNYSNAPLIFYTNNSERMRIAGDGNISTYAGSQMTLGGGIKGSASTSKGSTLANGAAWNVRTLSSGEAGIYTLWAAGGACHGYAMGFYRFFDSTEYGISNTIGGGYNGTIPASLSSAGVFTITNSLGCTMDNVFVNFLPLK
jgi:hypothetical protein